MNDLKEVILYTWKNMDKKKKIVAGVVLVIIIAFIMFSKKHMQRSCNEETTKFAYQKTVK